ncbi:sterol desaturase family protein [Algoriphagus sediminis]|uniref:Sterol desaturase family protein n=1 Tax=Algoriphagus sediminis TaxID=3057113 RepID=A0ABT7YA44_9BACT|nr:sterol desaturase family protein [Algoriphagus sediminis]MDN3203387.1 sterol desaturase family protein [Algoriphagus sediminis]
MKYFQTFLDGYYGYWDYLKNEILHPSWGNYFYWLIGLSLFVYALELLFPWRKNRGAFRKDFWQDAFYMFFNFFLFSLVGYNAISNVAVEGFNDFLGLFGVTNLVAIEVSSWPVILQFLLMFIAADFIQWNVHRMLHYVPWLWEFHKLHHSVKEMGFAAHLRYHWMETIVYKSIQYIPLAMIGFGLDDFLLLNIFTILIGHLNHANINLTYGPFKYVLNNPVMHTWHHAKTLPKGSYGVNFGITLSLWDYLFGTAYIPNSGRDEPLGFENDEEYPDTFWKQITYPWTRKKAS